MKKRSKLHKEYQHTSVTDYHVNAQSDWLHRCRPAIDRRHLELLKMASPSRFREVCEEDVQNVLQSAIPEKKRKKTKLQSME